MDEELTDEELAAETDHGGELVAELPPPTWHALTAIGGGAPGLLTAVERSPAHAAAAVARYLARLGLPPPAPPGAGVHTALRLSLLRP